MSQHQKPELTWIGKYQRPRLEPRILLEDPERSYHAKQRVMDTGILDNRLIKGVFIDPPYNTGSAFTHDDDGLEHSI